MLASRRRIRLSPAVILAGWVIAVLVIHVIWLHRFRAGAVPEYDESGYMANALHDLHGLQDRGLRGLGDAFLTGAPSAPLVPLLTVGPYLLFGATVGVSVVTQLVALAALAAATFALGRRFMVDGWAALAAGVTISTPVVTDFSRTFHFAIPAAAFLTSAAWALARSDALRRTRWAALAGFFIGCMVLSRTMTIAYLPGIGVAALVLALARSDKRAARLRSVAVLVGVTMVVAATWLVPRANYSAVRHYLVGTGYGEGSSQYGAAQSPLSVGYWLKEFRVLTSEVQLPLMLALVACLVALIVVRLLTEPIVWSRVRAAAVRLARSPVVIPVAIVVEGYLALTSSRNVGTAFSVPWIPSLVLLCVLCVSRVTVKSVRMGVVGVVGFASLFTIAVKSDSVRSLTTRRIVHIPVLGTVVVTDGDWLARADVAGDGYRLPPPDRPLPAVHRQWLTFAEDEMGAVLDFAKAHGRAVHLIVGTGDVVLSTTRFALGSELAERTHIGIERLTPQAGTAEYAAALKRSPGYVLVTADPPPNGGELNQEHVTAAARAAGFTSFRTAVAPDGRRVRWWWR